MLIPLPPLRRRLNLQTADCLDFQFISCLILAIERPRTTPGSLISIHGSLILVQLVLSMAVPGLLRGWTGVVWLAEASVPLLSLATILNMPMRDPSLGSIGISKPFTAPTSSLRSPEDAFTLWQWLTISWMSPMISLGKLRQLNDEDVWLLPLQFQHTRLHLLFREVKGSVIGRLVKANGPDLFITAGLGVLESILALSSVVFLKYLLAALDSGEGRGTRVAITYAVLSLFSRWAQAQSGVLSIWFSRRCYERSRGEMITMIFEKTLRRKAFTIPSADNTDLGGGGEEDDLGEMDDPISTARASSPSWVHRLIRQFKSKPVPPTPDETPASTGKILNLMRNDVYEVAQRFWEFSQLITKPLTFALSLALLWGFLGPASLLGIALLLAGLVINFGIAKALLRIERSRRAATDTKLKLTTEFVEAIRHLRWYDWQDSWLRQILESRRVELHKMVVVNLLNKAIATVNILSAYMFPVAGFYGYTVITGKPLTVDVAFPALELFNLLQNSMRELPDLLMVLLKARVAMGRIEAFMAEPDKGGEADDHGHGHGHGETVAAPMADDLLDIEFREASFSWPGMDREVLRRVSFSCRPGLTAVCGEVGIGKTALLHAILGELDQHGGDRRVPDEMVGYCAQSPWLQSMSIRENILFSAVYDEQRYRQVLDACCLLPDLGNFKAGDLSLIGENGVGLSGGQRARVALARAVYSRSRILLLDDPIAALDHQTAETILRKLFGGNGNGNGKGASFMAGRLVVFVTHRVDLILRYADQVLDIVEGGRVTTIYRQEMSESEALCHLAKTATIQHDDVADEEAAHPENTAIPDKFIEEEYRAEGGVVASVYWRYVKAGSLTWWAITVACFVGFRVVRIAYFWFLKQWAEAYHTSQSPSLYGQWMGSQQHEPSLWQVSLQDPHKKSSWLDISLGLPDPESNVRPWLFWFFILALGQVLAFTLSELTLVVIVYKAGKRIFTDVMRRVSNATFRFYDVTPVGRLMNRVTSDIGTMDGQIANQVMQVAWSGVGWLSSVVVIAAMTPVFLVLTLTMTSLFVYIFMRFLPTSQSLRRLETTSLSPLMSNFGTLLEGLTTVRAFRAQPNFQARVVGTTDDFQKMDHFFWSLQAWLSYRFDTLSALSTFAMTVTALRSGLSSGSVAFVLAAAGNFVLATHQLCRKYGELQMQFVSVERVIELLDLEQEPAGDVTPPAGWPTYDDDVVFDNVTLRYARGLDPALVAASFRIPAGSTVAVTGRTGSGKSTLALALVGAVLPDTDDDAEAGEGSGSIRIGGVDVARADKHALRRSVSFVAQDPVLFPGTVRVNLDPLREHSDAECAAVLARVLGGGGAAADLALGSRVDAGGRNLSQGQRQLVGLGRAVLRRSPVVILDEVISFFLMLSRLLFPLGYNILTTLCFARLPLRSTPRRRSTSRKSCGRS